MQCQVLPIFTSLFRFTLLTAYQQQGYPPQPGFAPQQGYGQPPQGYAPPPQGYAPPPQQGYAPPPQQSSSVVVVTQPQQQVVAVGGCRACGVRYYINIFHSKTCFIYIVKSFTSGSFYV